MAPRIEWASRQVLGAVGSSRRRDLESPPASRRRRRAGCARQAARSTLIELGIDPMGPAYLASVAARSAPDEATSPLLTPRESAVLRLIEKGCSYKQAGFALGVNWRTVQTHAHNLYSRLGVSSKIEALNVARELGLLGPPSGGHRPSGERVATSASQHPSARSPFEIESRSLLSLCGALGRAIAPTGARCPSRATPAR